MHGATASIMEAARRLSWVPSLSHGLYWPTLSFVSAAHQETIFTGPQFTRQTLTAPTILKRSG